MSDNVNIKVGIILSYITLAVSVLGAIFITPRVLYAIGDAQYGFYSFATSITSWLTIISGAMATSYIRFATIAYKETNSIRKVNSIYFKLYAFLSIAIILIVAIATGIILLSGFKIKQYTDSENTLILILLFISSIQIVVNLIFSVFTHFCSYNKKFIILRLTALITSILSYLLNFAFAIWTESVISIAIISVVLSAVYSLSVMFYAFFNKENRIVFERARLKDNKILIKSIAIFSCFIILNTIVDRINNEIDKTILGIMVNAESVTMYTLSKTFIAYLLTLSITISGSFAPKINELVVNNKREELNTLFLKVSSVQILILCLIIGGFVACGKSFVVLWLGNSKESIYYYAIPFMLIEIVPFTYTFTIEVQRAMNKHKFRAFVDIALALVNVGVSVLLVYLFPKEYAIWAVTIGTVLSVIIGNWVILCIYNSRALGLPMGKYYLNVLKYVLFAGIGVAPAILVVKSIEFMNLRNIYYFLIGGSIFVTVYFLSILLFDRKTLVMIIYKLFGKGQKKAL